MEVQLNYWELFRAAIVGITWHLESIWKESKPRVVFDDAEGWGANIEGACGECAFAKGRGLYWAAHTNTYTRFPDVGDVEVRTRTQHWHDLIIRKHDRPDRKYVLVTGQAYPKPIYRLRGWIWGYEAMQPEYLANHGGKGEAFFVPADKLHDLEDLD